MIDTQYHINELHANLNPDTDRTRYVNISISIEYGQAEFESEKDRFETDATIQLYLKSYEDIKKEEEGDEVEPEFGEISMEVTIAFSISRESDDLADLDLKKQAEIWNDEGYRHVDSNILSQLESGIMPNIFAPIEHLLEDSFAGITPRYRFSLTEEEEEKDDEIDSEEDK